MENLEPIVLFNGYSKYSEKDTMLANCSCVLIKGPVNIIIDTMTAWDGDKIVAALKAHDLNCSDINYVICTHGHSDHVGCNYLFRNAKHFVGFSISVRDEYFEHDFQSGLDYELVCDKVTITPTPGHTMQDVTVLVKAQSGVYAITGDLFENEDDLNDEQIWKDAGSDCEELQRKNRDRILQIADYIVPGHGRMFKVPQHYKK